MKLSRLSLATMGVAFLMLLGTAAAQGWNDWNGGYANGYPNGFMNGYMNMAGGYTNPAGAWNTPLTPGGYPYYTYYNTYNTQYGNGAFAWSFGYGDYDSAYYHYASHQYGYTQFPPGGYY